MIASQPGDSNGSKTEEIYLTTSASKYATIDPVASNTGGSTSTNPSPEQTVDKYSDIDIDDIDDSDYVPPEESEGSSDDSQDEEETDKMLVDSQEVEELQNEESNQVVFAQYSREGTVVTHSSSDDRGNISEPLLWETHASTEQLQNSFNMILQASSSNWTHHCGLISFNPSLSLLPLWSSIEGRILATTVTHNSNLFELLTIYVIYVPATSTARLNFLCESNRLLQFHQAPEGRCILMGDFNHNIHKSIRSDRAVEWQH
ncbi:hypothetical protein G6F61_012581 [Rhizopus arrhizus]|nr:hypothetical protein G6F61_012581 [Rhizopus arrhizus]